jgi:hypothetical protein
MGLRNLSDILRSRVSPWWRIPCATGAASPEGEKKKTSPAAAITGMPCPIPLSPCCHLTRRPHFAAGCPEMTTQCPTTHPPRAPNAQSRHLAVTRTLPKRYVISPAFRRVDVDRLYNLSKLAHGLWWRDSTVSWGASAAYQRRHDRVGDKFRDLSFITICDSRRGPLP